ncbi:MAG: hypothetical protein EBS85_03810 [Micrococcales bacterium]|nr:hypothetical protein [Actinomycetota bacterium]NCA07836.1 hypothetical protein [Micrococcales bacterium]
MSETYTVTDGTFDLEILAGSTFPSVAGDCSFYPTDSDGVAFSLTGYTAKLQVREQPSTTAVIDMTPTVNISDNSVSFSLTPTQTSLLTKTDYVYAIELTQTSTSKVLTLVRGQVLVTPEIVR